MQPFEWNVVNESGLQEILYLKVKIQDKVLKRQSLLMHSELYYLHSHYLVSLFTLYNNFNIAMREAQWANSVNYH